MYSQQQICDLLAQARSDIKHLDDRLTELEKVCDTLDQDICDLINQLKESDIKDLKDRVEKFEDHMSTVDSDLEALQSTIERVKYA